MAYAYGTLELFTPSSECNQFSKQKLQPSIIIVELRHLKLISVSPAAVLFSK